MRHVGSVNCMSKSRRGKLNESEFARALRSFDEGHKGFWWSRWPDHRDWVRINPKLQAPRAPCDFVASYKGRFYALELKSTRGSRFHMAWLKPHQEESLLDVKHSGCASYLVFMKRGRPVQCWAIDIENYLRLKDRFIEAGYKSISVKAMGAVGVELPRIRGTFEIAPLFDHVPPKRLRGIEIKKRKK